MSDKSKMIDNDNYEDSEKFLFLRGNKLSDLVYSTFYTFVLFNLINSFCLFIFKENLFFDELSLILFYYNVAIVIFYYLYILKNEKYNGFPLTKYILNPMNQIIGVFLFGKTSSVRNIPRWDLILFRISLPVATLIFFLNLFNVSLSENKEIYQFIGAFFGLTCWQIYNRKSNQFSTCYRTALEYMDIKTNFKTDYVDILNNSGVKCRKIGASVLKKELFASSLAIELIHFDLWNHKSFGMFFFSHIDKTYKHFCSNYVLENKAELSISEVKKKLIAYHLEINTAITSVDDSDFFEIDDKSLLYKLSVAV